MQKVVILRKYNPYWSFYYFAEQVEASLRRKGYDPLVIDFDEQTAFLERIVNLHEPLFFITFVKLTKPSLMSLFQYSPHRLLFWRVDPIEWTKIDMVNDEKFFIATVDKFEEEYIKSFHIPKNVMFLPHAADSLLTYEEQADRPIDLLFCASSYDHLAIEKKIDKLPPEAKRFIFSMIENYDKDPKVTVTELVKAIEESERPSYHLLIDSYIRAKERYDLINAIHDVEIHIFGGTAFDNKEYPVRGWSEIFRHKPNLVIHPAVSFSQSLEVMREAKIVLNSMPFFKNGTHERVFNSLAVGALPLTNKNVWFSENFVDGEELVFFQRERINDQVNELLADDTKRREIVRKGHKKVMRDHTWDNRIDQIIRWYLND